MRHVIRPYPPQKGIKAGALGGYIELPGQNLPVANMLLAIPTIPAHQGLGVVLPGGSILLSAYGFTAGWYYMLTVHRLLNLVFSFAAYLVSALGFPIIVSRGLRFEKIHFRAVFKDGLSQTPNVLLYVLAMLSIVIALSVGGGFVVALGRIFTNALVAYFLYFIILVFSVFILMRLWLVLPVLLLERTVPEGSRSSDSNSNPFIHERRNSLSRAQAQINFLSAFTGLYKSKTRSDNSSP